MPLPQFPALPRPLRRFQSTLITLLCFFFIVLPLLWAACCIVFIWIVWQLAESFRIQFEREQREARARAHLGPHGRGLPSIRGGSREEARMLGFTPSSPSFDTHGQGYPLTPPMDSQDWQGEWERARQRAARASMGNALQMTGMVAALKLENKDEGEGSRPSSGRRVSFQLDEEHGRGRRRQRPHEQEEAHGGGEERNEQHSSGHQPEERGVSSTGSNEGSAVNGGEEESRFTPVD